MHFYYSNVHTFSHINLIRIINVHSLSGERKTQSASQADTVFLSKCTDRPSQKHEPVQVTYRARLQEVKFCASCGGLSGTLDQQAPVHIMACPCGSNGNFPCNLGYLFAWRHLSYGIIPLDPGDSV